jgi:hypothetical protein
MLMMSLSLTKSYVGHTFEVVTELMTVGLMAIGIASSAMSMTVTVWSTSKYAELDIPTYVTTFVDVPVFVHTSPSTRPDRK